MEASLPNDVCNAASRDPEQPTWKEEGKYLDNEDVPGHGDISPSL
jgi:hypothetical protein